MADEMIVRSSTKWWSVSQATQAMVCSLAGNIFLIFRLQWEMISVHSRLPADIRAPQGSLTGVSGFQVHIGAGKVFTPGDEIRRAGRNECRCIENTIQICEVHSLYHY